MWYFWMKKGGIAAVTVDEGMGGLAEYLGSVEVRESGVWLKERFLWNEAQ